MQLWCPFQGPSLFDYMRTEPADVLHAKLVAAGHDPLRRVLYVAFDTQSTVADIVSVPPASGRWWIVRDGLSRELLRPVTTWVEEHRRAVVTLNSHGQVTSLVSTPEVAAPYNLPQGARGVTATPLSRVHGYLTAAGLVLMEASLGSVSGTLPRTLSVLSLAIMVATPCHAMMQRPSCACKDPSSMGKRSRRPLAELECGHTLWRPRWLFRTPESPTRLDLQRLSLGPTEGFEATAYSIGRFPGSMVMRLIIIHYPAGLCPPFVFWLLHYPWERVCHLRHRWAS